MDSVSQKFLQYGISTELAAKAHSNGLTISKCRSLSQKDIVSKFHMSKDEAKFLANSIKRKPIDSDTLNTLLERSNYVCNICKGQKSPAFIVHHIEKYEVSQNNEYYNLIVLCPNDHDLAHQSGLSLKITKDQLYRTKDKWEKEVERKNADRASKAIDVDESSIDYVNIKRIEELCIRIYGKIPVTSLSKQLKTAGILNKQGSFDQQFVHQNLSGGRYLFDYIGHGETEHYRKLLKCISDKTDFIDLDSCLSNKILRSKSIEGKYAYFIGGVYSKGVKTPITLKTPPVLVYYKRKNFFIEWIVDPMFLMSMSSIIRMRGKCRYLIYCLINSIEYNIDKKLWMLKASPLLIAQPSTYVNKTPMIAYIKMEEQYLEEETDFEEDLFNN